MPAEAAYTKFQRMIAREGGRLTKVSSTDPAATRNLQRSMLAALIGSEEPAGERTAPLGPQDTFGAKLLQRFTEIADCVDAMDAAERLVRRSPPRRSGVSALAYLRLIIESYLSEAYILRERSLVFITFLDRSFRRDLTWPVSLTRATAQYIADALKPVTDARSQHVHQDRYTDAELRRVSLFTLLESHYDTYKPLLRASIRQARAGKAAWMKDNNERVTVVMEEFFNAILPLVFPNGTLRRLPGRQGTATRRSNR